MSAEDDDDGAFSGFVLLGCSLEAFDELFNVADVLLEPLTLSFVVDLSFFSLLGGLGVDDDELSFFLSYKENIFIIKLVLHYNKSQTHPFALFIAILVFTLLLLVTSR